MIAGKSVEEVIKDMRTDAPTSIGQLIEILDFYGIGHAEKNKYYDPEFGLIEGEYTHGKITSFLEIYADERADLRIGQVITGWEGNYVFQSVME